VALKVFRFIQKLLEIIHDYIFFYFVVGIYKEVFFIFSTTVIHTPNNNRFTTLSIFFLSCVTRDEDLNSVSIPLSALVVLINTVLWYCQLLKEYLE